MKVTSSHPVPLAEVEEVLSKRKKDEELAYEQQQSLEHAEKFKKGSAKDAEKIIASITKNEKVSQETAVKIADIMPKKLETLKAILIKDKVSLSDDEVNDIFKLLHS